MLLPQLLKLEGLVTVMVMMLMMVPDYSEGHTTCTATTTVYNTSVTCLFAEDISQLGFNVQFFFPNTSVEPKTILACNRQMSGGLVCYKGSQILFDEKQKIVDRFTLSRPPSLNKLHGGHYRCSAVRPLITRSDFCPLTYRDVSRLVPVELPSAAHNEPPPPKDGNDAIHVFMLVAIAIMLILLIIIISDRFYPWLKRKSVALWCSRRAAEKKRPGGVEDANENILLRGLETRIPDGLAQDYYNMESSTQTTIQHDKRDPHVEGGEWRAAVDVSQAGPQSSQRDSVVVHSPPQRGQRYPAQQLSSQPTNIDSESSEKQPEVAEEAMPMLGESGPETMKARGPKKQSWIFRKGRSHTSKHGARGKSKKRNTRAWRSSENEGERERQERENRETRGGQESDGEEENWADIQDKRKKMLWRISDEHKSNTSE